MTHPPASDQSGDPTTREPEAQTPPFPPANVSGGTPNGSFAQPLVPPGEGTDPDGRVDDLDARPEAGVKAAGRRSTRTGLWFLVAVAVIVVVLIIVIAALSS